MFHHLNGSVTDLEPGLAVIECGGVGFAVNTTAYTSLHSLFGSEVNRRMRLQNLLT